ncbi:MAG: tetratricopeptide repeat protein, partial [Chthoniobacterales bacterium]
MNNGDSTPSDVEPRSPTGSGIPRSVWYLAVIPSFLSFGFTMMRGSDLWFHLAIGRWIIEHKSLPLVDPWSFTRNGQPWLQHEWLTDLLFATTAKVFGQNSLVYVKWILLVATFLLLFRVVWRLSKEPLSGYLSVLLGAAVAAPFLDLRPHLVTNLFYVLLLCLLLPRKRPPFYLPLLFLVWANLHGGFFFGLMALLVLLSPTIIFGEKSDRIRAALIWLASALLSLLNPSGWKAFAYPLKYAFDRSSAFKELDEWRPPFVDVGTHSPLYPYAIALFALATLFLLFRRWRGKQDLNWAALGLILLTLAMSLTSRRFIVLFALSQSLITGPALAVLLVPIMQRIPKLITPILAAGLGLFWLYSYPLVPYAFHYLTAEDDFPVETCSYIQVNHLSGNVFSYYNWGGYLHLRTNGQMKVFIDGRADTVYDSETFRQYLTVQRFQPGWKEVIESSGAQYILWPRSSQGAPMAELVATGEWKMLFDDFVSVLLVRTDQAPPEPLQLTPESPYRQLTIGTQNLERRRYNVAELALKRALEEMPYLRTAFYKLAQAQASQGKKEEALKTLDQCERVFPDRAR